MILTEYINASKTVSADSHLTSSNANPASIKVDKAKFCDQLGISPTSHALA